MLYSEFALTRRLRHNNVLRPHTFEVDTDCQRAFITMELMRGLTLDKLLCERPLGLPWKELRDIALPLLDALAYAHARGVLHGDMKPSNVMLSEEGVRLFDFGLGQAEEGILPGLPHLSRNRFNAWTPGYAAPRTARRPAAVGQRGRVRRGLRDLRTGGRQTPVPPLAVDRGPRRTPRARAARTPKPTETLLASPANGAGFRCGRSNDHCRPTA